MSRTPSIKGQLLLLYAWRSATSLLFGSIANDHLGLGYLKRVGIRSTKHVWQKMAKTSFYSIAQPPSHPPQNAITLNRYPEKPSHILSTPKMSYVIPPFTFVSLYTSLVLPLTHLLRTTLLFLIQQPFPE